MSMTTVSVDTKTKNRLDGDKGLYESQQKRAVSHDEFINHLLDGWELGEKIGEATGQSVQSGA